MSSETLYRHEWNSPLGKLRLFAKGSALVGIYFEGHKPAPKLTGGIADASPFKAATAQLEEYFAGERSKFDIPVSFEGTEFQVQVWSRLREIPCGETLSYGQFAVECSRPKAVRAVGAAVGRNPISIVVPCHRVVGANGALTGFAGGVERKRWLLDRERPLLASVTK